MSSKVLMPFLVSVCIHHQSFSQEPTESVHTVFGDVMEIVPSDDDRAIHFGRNDLASQDATTDRDITSEGAFFVCFVISPISVLAFSCPALQPTKTKINAPIYVPLMASEGVLNPRPISLNHRFSLVATFLPTNFPYYMMSNGRA